MSDLRFWMVVTWSYCPGRVGRTGRFTTASTPGEISGRGVGLDVVYDAVRRVQGTTELESSSSAGTTFAITVPLTISTVRILTVTSGGQHYGIPSSAIVRTGRVRYHELKELGGELVLTVDGEPVPWVTLADLLNLVGGTPASSDNGSYVLVLREGKPLAVAVDETKDESEVLLKPLGFPLVGIPGIVGGTIRPDGSVQLVLDVGDWARVPPKMKRPFRSKELEPAARVLVVDDSPTTRTMLRNVFAAGGFSVRTAVDGVDALERLRAHPADLVVTDVSSQVPALHLVDFFRGCV